MKQFSLIIIFSCFGLVLLGQAQPGLHVDEEHTVLFGKDTTSAGIKFLWYPSKAALRAGKTNGLNNMTSWDQSIVGPFTAAFGVDTEARGNYSFAAGLATFANSYAESSFGRYSLGGGDVTAWNPIDPLFEVGNGAGNAARANAFTIYKNGNAEFQRSIKLGDQAVGSSISNGTIRYNGADIQGRIGGAWQSLTSGNGSGGATPWSTTGSNIYYSTGDVAVGTSFILDDFTIGSSGTLGEETGISLRNVEIFGLPGQQQFTTTKIGRIWQTASSLNLGIPASNVELQLFDSGIKFDTPVLFSRWGFDFKHSEGNFSQAYKSQTWLKKAWRGDLGDYLYLGSTGNRAISNQHAMVLSQSGGIQFGKGNTNDGEGLGTHKIQMLISSFSNTLQSTNHLNIKAQNSRNVRFYHDGSAGGVTIGGTNLPAGYKLAVDGKIASEEVLVQLSGNWPDYVFDEEYDLLEVDQLESYINQNHHLPGIPTAAEIEEEGIQVGEMQKMQMEKIEELTLYIIELQKEIKALKIKVDSL